MSQTRDEKRFTISEVAADWNELLVVKLLLLGRCDRLLQR